MATIVDSNVIQPAPPRLADAAQAALPPAVAQPAAGQTVSPSPLIGAILVMVSVVVLGLAFPQAVGWQLIPLTLCGFLTMGDVVRWLRGEIETFDPLFFISVLLLLLTFIAPILHLGWNFYGKQIPIWESWPNAFARMAWLNFFALLVFRWVQNKAYHRPDQHPAEPLKLNQSRLSFAWLGAVGISMVAYVLLLALIGGYSGYARLAQDDSELLGFGWLATFSDAFPLLLAFMTAYQIKRSGRKVEDWWLIAYLVFIIGLQFFWAGMRGGRNATIFLAFIVAGMFHFNLKPIKVRLALAGLVLLVIFAYLYGFYKFGGIQVVKDFLRSPSTLAYYQQRQQRVRGFSPQFVLLTDLSRADVQTYLLETTLKPPKWYDFPMGGTYVAGAVVWVPRKIWPSRPSAGPQTAFTTLQNPNYRPGDPLTKRLFGVGGEALLNFGWWGVPLAYAIYGYLLGRFRHSIKVWEGNGDERLFLASLVELAFIFAVIADFQSFVGLLFKDGLLLFAIYIFAKEPRGKVVEEPATSQPA